MNGNGLGTGEEWPCQSVEEVSLERSSVFKVPLDSVLFTGT